jgi:hypothetical protein
MKIAIILATLIIIAISVYTYTVVRVIESFWVDDYATNQFAHCKSLGYCSRAPVLYVFGN